MTQDVHKLILTMTHPSVDLLDQVNLLFFDLGSTGTQIESAADYMTLEQDLFGEILPVLTEEDLAQATVVTAYFDQAPDQKEAQVALEALTDQAFELEAVTESAQDWQAQWMASYEPIRLSRYLTIVPEWLDYQAQPQEALIYLDPGVAFGTGYHETTQLAVQALETYLRGGERVLDVGTGSGILAFVAAQLGARLVHGYDLDSQAITSAKKNLALQVAQGSGSFDQVTFTVNDGLQGVDQEAEVIVANILPHILIDMLPDFTRLLAPGGYLILGGIVDDQGPKIEAAYQEAGYTRVQKTQLGDWLGYVLQKEGD